MIAVLFIAMLLPFTILKDESGNTLMSFSDLSLSSLSMPEISLPEFTPGSSNKGSIAADDSDLSGKDIFYKWYDNEGNVQFTSEPPPEGVDYSLKGFDPNANVILSLELPADQKEKDGSEAKPVKAADAENDINPYSADSIKKLFEETRNIEKMLKQRLEDQESVINQ